MEPVFVVHGGASSEALGPEEWQEHLDGVREACQAGAAVLQAGGLAEDAVTQAIVCMEENVLYDAGYGSHLDQRGRVSLDAAMVRGEDLAFAGLIGLERCRNPIEVARVLLDDPDLILLHGAGAEAYAAAHGTTLIENASLVCPRERERFATWQRDGFTGGMEDYLTRRGPGPDKLSDTVGAVALDRQGRLVAGNSTGGTPFKPHGRVGDTPLPGCGAIAEDPIGAVCSTGWGEAISRMTLASRVLHMLVAGQTPQEAVAQGVALFHERTQSECGLLCIDGQGRLGVAFNSPQMPWAALCRDGSYIDAESRPRS